MLELQACCIVVWFVKSIGIDKRRATNKMDVYVAFPVGLSFLSGKTWSMSTGDLVRSQMTLII